MEQSTTDESVFSAREQQSLEISAAQRLRFIDRHFDLDLDTKMAALKASPFVVALVSFSGEEVLSQSCGTIIEVEKNNNTVMTSFNLIRRPCEARIGENSLADNLKVVVRSFDGKSYVGEVCTYDFHYNLLIVMFKSKSYLQSAKLKMINNDRSPEKTFQLHRHNLRTKPGDPVAIVGRYYCQSLDLMAAAGRFSMDRCDSSLYDCKELLTAVCPITICGDGGPLINLSAEVLGIAFYHIGAVSPVLPINIVYKWWNNHKRFNEPRHPSYGFDATNLYVARLPILERLMRRYPSTSNGLLAGLLVETVLPGSYAESADLREDDVILTCDGKAVNTFLELWDLMWDKVGKVVKLEVDRDDHSTPLTLTLTIGEVVPNQMNKWPRYDYPRRRQ